jgi:hypothetical protein
MKKLRPEDLKVDSFTTLGIAPNDRGTVHARRTGICPDSWEPETCPFSCAETCTEPCVETPVC